ncbi:hypothetical protein JCM4914_57610 [Streptomyces platensis subsp. malvinus]
MPTTRPSATVLRAVSTRSLQAAASWSERSFMRSSGAVRRVRMQCAPPYEQAGEGYAAGPPGRYPPYGDTWWTEGDWPEIDRLARLSRYLRIVMHGTTGHGPA